MKIYVFMTFIAFEVFVFESRQFKQFYSAEMSAVISRSRLFIKVLKDNHVHSIPISDVLSCSSHMMIFLSIEFLNKYLIQQSDLASLLKS